MTWGKDEASMVSTKGDFYEDFSLKSAVREQNKAVLRSLPEILK